MRSDESTKAKMPPIRLLKKSIESSKRRDLPAEGGRGKRRGSQKRDSCHFQLPNSPRFSEVVQEQIRWGRTDISRSIKYFVDAGNACPTEDRLFRQHGLCFEKSYFNSLLVSLWQPFSRSMWKFEPAATKTPRHEYPQRTSWTTSLLIRGLMILWVCCMFCDQAFCGAKNDRVKLRNGDQLTGEVEKLAYGQLRFKTDDMGTVTIEWDKIDGLTSPEHFEIELSDGSIYFGSLGNTDSNSTMAVIGDSGTVEISRSFAVRITPVKDQFWSRISGSVSVGFNYTQASKVSQLNTDANATFTGHRNESAASISSVLTSQPGVEVTQRFDMSVSHKRLYGDRWFGIGNLGLQRNKALGLDLRLLLSGGGGRNVIQTNSEWLSLDGALQVNRESFADTTGSKYSLELVGTVIHQKFRYDDPELNLTTKLNVFGNLTTFGRVRGEFETSIAWEIVNDLFLNTSLYDSYDNEPPAGTTKNDFGIVLSFGYSF